MMTPAEQHAENLAQYQRDIEDSAKAHRTETAKRYLAALREQVATPVKGRR